MKKILITLLLTIIPLKPQYNYNNLRSQNTESQLSTILQRLRSKAPQNLFQSSFLTNLTKTSANETPLDKCDFKINLKEILSEKFPLKAICKPMRLEFENGLDSRSKAVFACRQNEKGVDIDFMVYIEGESFLKFKERKNFLEAISDPEVVYWKISNSTEFLDELDVRDSISCEKIKFAFSLFKRKRN